jgi:hypothetical protein
MSIISGGGAVVGAGAAGGYQIERSLRFNSADSAYLNRTPASAGNRQTWTFSFWTKRSTLGAEQRILFSNDNGLAHATIEFTSGDAVAFADYTDPSPTYELTTTQLFRDVSAWYHIVAVFDTTNATAGDRMRLYVNGLRVTAFGTANYPTQNFDGYTNNNVPHGIGARIASPVGQYFNGYLTEIYMIDGSALDPTSFGEFNSDTGVWQPKAYSGSYGTNGFYLNFSDNASTTTLGEDQAGSNDWTTNNFSVTAGAGNDSLVDTPTNYGTDTGVGGEVRGNYCTWNPLANLGLTLSNGNLTNAYTTALWTGTSATLAMDSGKWYFEYTVNATGAYTQIGVITVGKPLPTGGLQLQNGTTFAWGYQTYGVVFHAGSETSSGITSATTNDVISVAVDIDAGKIWIGKNGTFFNSGNPAAGTNAAYTNLSGAMIPVVFSYGTESGDTNFGQRPFAYTAPSGFKALCTQNLPEPTIVDGGEYFNTVLYTGNNTTNVITGVGFQPDWLWIKSRSEAQNHALMDVLRGVSKQLQSSTTNAESTNSAGKGVQSFDADGFTLGQESDATGGTNNNLGSYVAWNWKANGAGSSNTDGTISSTVSVSTTSGFSIVTYTGTNVTGATVGHGLGTTPSMIIIKQRNVLRAWIVYHISIGNTGYIQLHSSDAEDKPNSTMFNNAGPSLTTFTIGSSAAVNESGGTYVAYCFAAVPGYSAFGSYTGNGSADGPFVYTGFRPAFVLVKASSAATDWYIYDTSRDTYNVATLELNPNLAAAEQNGTYGSMDINSNGFKLRFATGEVNASGATYIYYAVAENPFKYSLAR